MKLERLNEILSQLLAKDESVETTDLLNEIRTGFTENENNQKANEWEEKYNELEQRYISTFKSVLDKKEDYTPPTPKKEEKAVPPDALTTFDDIFIDEGEKK